MDADSLLDNSGRIPVDAASLLPDEIRRIEEAGSMRDVQDVLWSAVHRLRDRVQPAAPGIPAVPLPPDLADRYPCVLWGEREWRRLLAADEDLFNRLLFGIARRTGRLSRSRSASLSTAPESP